MKVLQTMRKQE